MNKKVENHFIKGNSFLMAVVLMAATIIAPLTINLGINENANLYILGLIFVLLFIQFVRGYRFTLPTTSVILIVMVVILFMFSKLSVAHSDYSFPQLLFYSLIPIFAGSQKVNSELVLKYMMYISLLMIPSLNRLLAYQYEGLKQAEMGPSYAILTAVAAMLIHYKYYREHSNLFIKMCYVYGAFLMINLIMVGTRGAILSLLILVLMLYINDYEKSGKQIEVNPQKIMTISLLIIIGFVIYMKLKELTKFLYNYFINYFGSAPSFIIKINTFIVNDLELSNGRNEIYDFLIEYIVKRPIFGYGLETFYYYSDWRWPWPHNFIFQFIFEGGLFFAIIPIILSVSMLIKVLFRRIKYKEEFTLGILLVSECFPKLLISTDPWKGTALWILISYSWIYHRRKIIRNTEM